MKYIIFILLLSTYSWANSIEFLTGGITYHLFNDPSVSQNYVTKLSGDGALIYNPLYGIRYTVDDKMFYNSYSFFGGENSIGQNMGGGLYSFGVLDSNVQLGFALGAYLQNGELFNQQVDTFTNGNIIPLYGFEFNYKVDLGNKCFIKLNNLLTPLLYNATIGIGQEF